MGQKALLLKTVIETRWEFVLFLFSFETKSNLVFRNKKEDSDKVSKKIAAGEMEMMTRIDSEERFFFI